MPYESLLLHINLFALDGMIFVQEMQLATIAALHGS